MMQLKMYSYTVASYRYTECKILKVQSFNGKFLIATCISIDHRKPPSKTFEITRHHNACFIVKLFCKLMLVL